MIFNDLRDFIDKSRALGEVQDVEGADWDVELGSLADLKAATPNSPLLLFDKIKGYPAGFRVAANPFTSTRRTALGLDLPLEAGKKDQVQAMRAKLKKGVTLVPPVEVETGPVKENSMAGDQVDLNKFPAPRWREGDTGRYIGCGDLVIMRDPDEGWVNVASQMVAIHDKTRCAIYMSPGRHNGIIRNKYFAKGMNCPVAVCCGQDPTLEVAAGLNVPWGVSEFDYAGWLNGGPIQVTRGVTTDLPIPATAEIVLEGELVRPEEEPPIPVARFGDWAGYYVDVEEKVPVFRVKSILYRNNPIILGNPPAVLPSVWTLGRDIHMSAVLWDELDRQVPGVQGCWLMGEAGLRHMVVVSIKQMYGGHAKHAAMAAASCNAVAYMLRYVIVVDEDVDPTNINEVLWALGTRCDPEDSIDILRGWWSSPGPDVLLSPEKRKRRQYEHSLAVITACKPFYWIKDFPPSSKVAPEMEKKLKEKWAKLF